MQPTIINAAFVKSAPSLKEALPEGVSEVVFMGRSNVGKSSTLNRLCNRKNLAKSSATPGKTRLINFFDITYKHREQKYAARFVDLPGFGYAKVSKDQKQLWQQYLNEYITNRVSIRTFVHLIDARQCDLAIDKAVSEYIQSILRPDQCYLSVYTKADKLNQSQRTKLQNRGGILVSNTKNSGTEKLNRMIFDSLYRID
ncbi:MAG: ribosome biogenesis GTP-binding protein YihA/YsxC [Campylobacterota bacterium]